MGLFRNRTSSSCVSVASALALTAACSALPLRSPTVPEFPEPAPLDELITDRFPDAAYDSLVHKHTRHGSVQYHGATLRFFTLPSSRAPYNDLHVVVSCPGQQPQQSHIVYSGAENLFYVSREGVIEAAYGTSSFERYVVGKAVDALVSRCVRLPKNVRVA